VELVDPHRQQGDEHAGVRDGIQEERRPQAEALDQRPGDRASEHAGAHEDGAVQADRVRDVLLPDQLHVERLAGRWLDREDQPRQEGDHEHHPDLDDVGGHEGELNGGEHAVPGVGPNEDAALVEPVGDGTRPHPEEQDREEEQGGLDAQGDTAVGEVEDQNGSGGPVHPRACDRDQLPDEEQPEVPRDVHRGERLPHLVGQPGHASRLRGAPTTTFGPRRPARCARRSR
jgi:hypothetical protein